MWIEIQCSGSGYLNMKSKIQIFIKTIYCSIVIKSPWKLFSEYGNIGECRSIVFQFFNHSYNATAFNLKLKHTFDKTIHVYENKSTSY